MVWLVRHPQTKGRATDRPNLNHRVTSRLYLLDAELVRVGISSIHGSFRCLRACLAAIYQSFYHPPPQFARLRALP